MEPFCPHCLVTVRGQRYCVSCKVMALGGRAPVFESITQPCAEASEALKYGIVSLLCIGIILGPIAISKGLAARRMMEANPNLTGSGKATAAIILGIVGFVFSLLLVVGKVAKA